jgi:ribosomal protein S18 acetylase RimI-like enzyme
MIITQIQHWHYYDKVIIMEEHCHAIVMMDIYKKKQKNFGGDVYLFDLYTDEQYRRQGLAKALMAEAEKVAREYGKTAIFLEWDKKETPYEILDWYMSLGYDETEFGPTTALLKKELK